MEFGDALALSAPANESRLAASSNSRHLTLGGKPFLLIGDTAWGLTAQSLADATTYLQDRAARGFNAIVVDLMEPYFSADAPNNANGDAPFVGTAFQSAPDGDFFDHCAAIFDVARSLDLLLLVSPVYTGFAEGAEGWASEINAASDSQLQDFGVFVGGRFGGYRNLVWTIGGDANPGTTHQARLTAFTTGLLSADASHLVTAHWAPESTAGDYLGVVNVTLDTVYSYSDTLHSQAASVYGNAPIKPFILYETEYENEHSVTSQEIRARSWWSLLRGACGVVFGNDPIWYFGVVGDGNPGHSFADSDTNDWDEVLNSAGAQSTTRIGALLAGRPWYLLEPDSSNTAMTAGHSTGADLATAALAPDGSLFVAYLPSSRQVTLDMTVFSASVNVFWSAGADGAETAEGSFAATGTQNFTPPSAGDWILVAEVS